MRDPRSPTASPPAPCPPTTPRAVAALLAAAEQVDDTGEFPDAEDVAEWWRGWGLDPGRDGWPCATPAGLVIAYATVMASPTFRDAFAVDLEGRVRPDLRGRGIGRALLAWQLDRGRRCTPSGTRRRPAALTVEVPGGMPSLEALVRRAGLAAERWYREMQRPLTDLPTLRPVPGRRAGAVQPGTGTTRSGGRTTPPSPSTTAPPSGTRRPGGRCSPGSAASAPTCPAWPSRTAPSLGYVLAYVFEADTAGAGHAEVVPRADRGPAAGARARAGAGAHRRGAARRPPAATAQSAGLGVDTENVTGALRLYE